jgi:hypothetical protein
LESDTPDRPIAIGTLETVELDEETFREIMQVLTEIGLLDEPDARQAAKRVTWRHPTE